MDKNVSILEKMCRSFDSEKMKPILSAKDAVSAVIVFENRNHPSVYCPLRGKRVEKNNVTLLEYYCKAKHSNPNISIICPYSQRYEK